MQVIQGFAKFSILVFILSKRLELKGILKTIGFAVVKGLLNERIKAKFSNEE